MARPRKYSNEEMIAALKETKGMVYLAAARIGCDADTIYNRAKVTPAVARCMKAERGKMVDTAELKLHNAILNSEPWAIQMALKCLGKDRGYVERQEVQNEHSGHGGAPVIREVVVERPAPVAAGGDGAGPVDAPRPAPGVG